MLDNSQASPDRLDDAAQFFSLSDQSCQKSSQQRHITADFSKLIDTTENVKETSYTLQPERVTSMKTTICPLKAKRIKERISGVEIGNNQL